MILVDTNIWLALTLSKHVFHGLAREWFANQSAKGSILFCRSTQQSLLRLLTTEAVMRPYGIPPLTNEQAWALYQGIIADRRISWASEPNAREIDAHWQKFAANAVASPKLWMDSYLAAFAVAGGYRLVTTDRAFKQFNGLKSIVLMATKANPS